MKIPLGNSINFILFYFILFFKKSLGKSFQKSSVFIFVVLSFSPRNPHESKKEAVKIINPDGDLQKLLISALVASGFTRLPDNRSAHYYVPCSVGTFSNSSSQGAEGCIPCPPGIYYNNNYYYYYYYYHHHHHHHHYYY